MANWDEKMLEEVVDKKHGERNKSLPKTDIVSAARTAVDILYSTCAFRAI